MRLICHSLVIGFALAFPGSSPAQDAGIIRLTCEGVQETNTVAADPANNRKTKERRSAAITVVTTTGLAQFQNLGLIAFNMANEPVKCTVAPAEIHCAKDHRSNDLTSSSEVMINRYSGLLTESQMLGFKGAAAYITVITGEYKCQALEKPKF